MFVNLTRIGRVLAATASKWSDDKAPRLGASIAFYSMLSIGPLLLIFLSAAAVLYGQDAAQGRVLTEIDGLIGKEGARAIQDILAAAHNENEGIWAALFGFGILLIGASGVFGELQDAMNGIWRVEPKQRGIWALIRYRFLSFAMVLSIGFLLLISLILSTVIAAVQELGADYLPASTALIGAINAGSSFAVITVLFACIFKFVPDTYVPWRSVWPAAILTSALFILGKYAIGIYLGQTALSSAYGAGGSLVVLLVWVYYSAQILFFGAELSHVMAQKKA